MTDNVACKRIGGLGGGSFITRYSGRVIFNKKCIVRLIYWPNIASLSGSVNLTLASSHLVPPAVSYSANKGLSSLVKDGPCDL